MPGRKLAEIWLTNADRQDLALQKDVQAICLRCKKANFFVAVFVSGTSNLADATGELLAYNRTHPVLPETRQSRSRP